MKVKQGKLLLPLNEVSEDGSKSLDSLLSFKNHMNSLKIVLKIPKIRQYHLQSNFPTIQLTTLPRQCSSLCFMHVKYYTVMIIAIKNNFIFCIFLLYHKHSYIAVLSLLFSFFMTTEESISPMHDYSFLYFFLIFLY